MEIIEFFDLLKDYEKHQKYPFVFEFENIRFGEACKVFFGRMKINKNFRNIVFRDAKEFRGEFDYKIKMYKRYYLNKKCEIDSSNIQKVLTKHFLIKIKEKYNKDIFEPIESGMAELECIKNEIEQKIYNIKILINDMLDDGFLYKKVSEILD